MGRVEKIIRASVLFVSLFVSAYLLFEGFRLFVPRVREEFGFQFTFRDVEVPAWHAGVTFISVLLGTICGITIEGLLKSEDSISNISLIRSLTESATPLSIFIASVVFVLVFPTLYAASGDVSAYISAFQSSFLFRQFFSSIGKSRGSGDG